MAIMGIQESVTEYLRDQIIIGKLPPGERINELHLSRELNISRSPLREALRDLENERLVDIIPRKGSFAREILLEDYLEVHQICEMIECYAIDLLRSQKTKNLVHAHESIQKAISMPKASPHDNPIDILDFIRAWNDFHLKLVEAAGNRRLTRINRFLQTSLIRYYFFSNISPTIKKHKKGHQQILQFLEGGKYERAKQCLRDHLQSYAEKVIIKINQRNIEA